MEKHLINEAVSTPDLQGSNVKASAIKDKDLQASVSACDTKQLNPETNKGPPYR